MGSSQWRTLVLTKLDLQVLLQGVTNFVPIHTTFYIFFTSRYLLLFSNEITGCVTVDRAGRFSDFSSRPMNAETVRLPCGALRRNLHNPNVKLELWNLRQFLFLHITVAHVRDTASLNNILGLYSTK